MTSRIRRAWNNLRDRGKNKARHEARAIAGDYKPPAERPRIEIKVNRLYSKRKSLELKSIRESKGKDFGTRRKRKILYLSMAHDADRTIRMKNLALEAPHTTKGLDKKGESTRLRFIKDLRGSVGLMAEFGDTAVAREILPIVDSMIKAMDFEQFSDARKVVPGEKPSKKRKTVPADNREVIRELRAIRTGLLKINEAHNQEMARRRGNVRGLK